MSNDLRTFEQEVLEEDEGSEIPNPGSPEAQEQFCSCPTIDNHYGHGIPSELGPEFIISGDCPIHGF